MRWGLGLMGGACLLLVAGFSLVITGVRPADAPRPAPTNAGLSLTGIDELPGWRAPVPVPESVEGGESTQDDEMAERESARPMRRMPESRSGSDR